MSQDGSVTHWINQLKTNSPADGVAQQELWNRYFDRLTYLAKNRLRTARDRVADEEDIVISVFDSFFRGVEQNRYPELHDRTNLWPLLVTITARKALNQNRKAFAQKRGGGRVQGESALEGNHAEADRKFGIQDIAGTEPSPAFAAEVAEECHRRLESLDNQLRAVAEKKLQGFKNREIAEQMGVITETVERRLRRIRELWSKLEPNE